MWKIKNNNTYQIFSHLRHGTFKPPSSNWLITKSSTTQGKQVWLLAHLFGLYVWIVPQDSNIYSLVDQFLNHAPAARSTAAVSTYNMHRTYDIRVIVVDWTEVKFDLGEYDCWHDGKMLEMLHRQTDRGTGRRTETQANGQRHRQTVRGTDRRTETQADGQRHRQTDRDTGRRTETQAGRQKGTQAVRQPVSKINRQTHTYKQTRSEACRQTGRQPERHAELQQVNGPQQLNQRRRRGHRHWHRQEWHERK